MLAIVSDTHGRTDHRLDGRTLDAVREAEVVIHAGDFTTEAVYDAFATAAGELVAVAGNNDEPALADRLPSVATVEYGDRRFVVVHGHEHGETGLAMLAREREADVVVVGHSHRPTVESFGEKLLVNPGSYADPRRYRPAHVEVTAGAEGVRVRLRRPEGRTVTEVSH